MDKTKCPLSQRYEGGKCHGSLCGFWSQLGLRCGIGIIADEISRGAVRCPVMEPFVVSIPCDEFHSLMVAGRHLSTEADCFQLDEGDDMILGDAIIRYNDIQNEMRKYEKDKTNGES